MFASGAGGVHGWEIDIETYNIFLLVSWKPTTRSPKAPTLGSGLAVSLFPAYFGCDAGFSALPQRKSPRNPCLIMVPHMSGRLPRRRHLHRRRELRQALPPHLLLPPLAAEVVQNCQLDDPVHHFLLHHRHLLRLDLRVRPRGHELRRHDPGRDLHQRRVSVHRHGRDQHHLRRHPVLPAPAHRFQAADPPSTKVWAAAHFPARFHVST